MFAYKKFLTIFSPSLFIIFTCLFSMLFNNSNSLIAILLLLFYPLVFLLQGVISSINKTNIFLCLIISLTSFLLVSELFIDTLAIVNSFTYVSCMLIAYFITNYTSNLYANKKATLSM